MSAPNPKRRKPSTAGPSSLRQTSFPPSFSPDAPSPRGTRSPSVDSSVLTPSMRSGANAPGALGGGKKRKRRGATKDGGDGLGSTVAGGGGSVVNGGGSVVGGEEADPDAEGEEGEEGEGEEQAQMEGGKMTEAALKQERENLAMLVEMFTPEQADRYDLWRRVKLKKDQVRRLINHTLSQSVPPSVVTTVSGFSKVMLGELIEQARQVQVEWQAAATELPTGDKLDDDAPIEERTLEMDRGPLTPDHLREALRRYKKAKEGGAAGYLGLSLRGKEVTAARSGGRRLFR